MAGELVCAADLCFVNPAFSLARVFITVDSGANLLAYVLMAADVLLVPLILDYI